MTDCDSASEPASQPQQSSSSLLTSYSTLYPVVYTHRQQFYYNLYTTSNNNKFRYIFGMIKAHSDADALTDGHNSVLPAALYSTISLCSTTFYIYTRRRRRLISISCVQGSSSTRALISTRHVLCVPHRPHSTLDGRWIHMGDPDCKLRHAMTFVLVPISVFRLLTIVIEIITTTTVVSSSLGQSFGSPSAPTKAHIHTYGYYYYCWAVPI